MDIQFSKYHGTGNDFILISAYNKKFQLTNNQINYLCNRRFGIGADGLMLLKYHEKYAFEMEYYNSDGNIGSMCGNGGRCIAAFAHHHKIADNYCKFVASDGEHEAHISQNNTVKLKMTNVKQYNKFGNDYFINTGSPHYVKFVDTVDEMNVVEEGKKIRYNTTISPSGTNVNFVQIYNNQLYVRTYERGVEDETYSCGTGAIASALCYAIENKNIESPVHIKTKGGALKVYFEFNNSFFENIWLEGFATYVFDGTINI